MNLPIRKLLKDKKSKKGYVKEAKMTLKDAEFHL